MGDVIHTLAAVTSLRTAFSNMRIGWVIEKRWSELLFAQASPTCGLRSTQRPVADFVHVVDTRQWRKSSLAGETRQQIKTAWREIRDQHYDVAADFQGAMKSAFIARAASAKRVIGFNHPREAPARLFYKERTPAQGVHVIEQYRSLAEALAGKSLPNCAP